MKQEALSKKQSKFKTDLTIDPNEDFIISLTTEELQDYRSIFKIDVARTLSEGIKRQILLNKDFKGQSPISSINL